MWEDGGSVLSEKELQTRRENFELQTRRENFETVY